MKNVHDAIATEINRWFESNSRELPWRASKDPYVIWLSEIILQQTRVEQGTPYFLRFKEAFPSVFDLANATEDEVLKLWQGLGYYSRARNLHFTAQHVVNHYKGSFPVKYSELLTLKGIGQYTAAAIASISNEERVAAIDGNVNRVVSRLFGVTDPIQSKDFKQQISQHSSRLLENQKPSQHNQALMDFGAIICTPKNARCFECPVSNYCSAYQDHRVNDLPTKKKKTKKTNRFFHIAVIRDDENTIIEKRDNKEIWGGLWQFPLIETNSDRLLEMEAFKSITSANLLHISKTIHYEKHVLSHQNIFSVFYLIEADSIKNDYRSAALSELSNVAIPRLLDKFLEQHNWLDNEAK